MKLTNDKTNKIHLKLKSKEWVYRGEGNANVVLALPEHRQILRIRKTEKPKTLFEQLIDFLLRWLNWEVIYSVKDDVPETPSKNVLRIGKLKTSLEQIINWMVSVLNSKYKNIIYRELSDLKFYKCVIRPLLGYNYTCDATSVYISKDQITEIEGTLANFRPEHRKNKRLSYGKATLFEDFALLPMKLESEFNMKGATYAVEIKPKQGWYPYVERGNTKCQFCMKQYLKYRRGQIKSFSSYCPLDLFSGDGERMSKAIKALIENPQNNLKIFCNGEGVYGESFDITNFYEILPNIFDNSQTKEENEEEFCQFLLKVLTTNVGFKGCVTNGEKDCLCSCKVEERCHEENNDEGCLYTNSKLPHGCILERILFMQRFNELGLERYNEICKSIDLNDSNDWAYVEVLLENMNKKKIVCPSSLMNTIVNNSFGSCDCKTMTHMSLLQYLLFSIARDCSLMITFRKISGEIRERKDCIIQTKSGLFAVNIGVFDLYPKPISTIKKAMKRNTKISNAYRSLSNSIK